MNRFSGPGLKIKKLTILCITLIIVFFTTVSLVLSASSGKTGFQHAGLFNMGTIYRYEDGLRAYGWTIIDGNTYYFDTNTGLMQTGFEEIDGETYYFNNNGIMMTGKLQIDGSWYYLDEDGTLVTDSFFTLDDNGTTRLLYVDENGDSVKGTYALEDDTLVPVDDPESGNVTYIFDENGYLQIDTDSLAEQMNAILSSYEGNNSIYFKDLDTGEEIVIGDAQMYPCSIIKMFVMACVYDMIADGTLDYDTCLPYLEAMMIDSDNTSYNTLITLLGDGDGLNGLDVVNSFIRSLGITTTTLHHGLVPGAGFFTDGGDNTSSASDIGRLLEIIYDHDIATEEYCEEMLELMTRCADTVGIVDDVDEDFIVAHKTGYADSEYMDGGIITTGYGDYILVVFSETDSVYPCNEIAQLFSDTILQTYQTD